MMKLARWSMAAAVLTCVLQAAAQDRVLLLNAQEENRTCVVPRSAVASGTRCPPIAVPGNYFVQGHRIELQVLRRKFLADYGISIDGVTQLQSGPNIRNLNEAENLTLGPVSLATIPPSKGGAEGLTARTAATILFELVDETTATKPQADLDADRDVIQRERAKIKAQQKDFEKSFTLLRGDLTVAASAITLGEALGSPNVYAISTRLNKQFDEVSPLCPQSCPWNGSGPYTDEQEFRNVNTRVQDLITAVKTLGTRLSATDLQSKLTNLTASISQYENDINTFRGNARAAYDAAQLALSMDNGLRDQLRREEMKALLLDKLKGPDSKPVLDEAEMNALLAHYQHLSSANRAIVSTRWTDLEASALAYLKASLSNSVMSQNDLKFKSDLEDDRHNLQVDLPGAIADLNAAQGSLLNRVNYIYDHSEVPEPLPKQIDLSGHSGNLIVYFTIRRIETFQRYTVAQVQGPGSAPGVAAQGTPLPPPKGAAPSGGNPAQDATAPPPASPSGGNGSPSGSGQSTDTNQGLVVAKGSFEVHDVFHANVVAAVAFSTLKDQSITKQPQPQSCNGTPANPDPNCFSPVVSNSFKWAPIVGLDYYFQPRDTFPRAAGDPWLCTQHPGQCFGIMGAASVTKANNYFMGGFFEPVLGVQLGAGANFGTKTVLQSPYKNGVPVDITGDFPTTDKRGTGVFVSAGLDLGIFRKVFGKFTGIGTSASGTSGK
jgi:hypothetical protein